MFHEYVYAVQPGILSAEIPSGLVFSEVPWHGVAPLAMLECGYCLGRNFSTLHKLAYFMWTVVLEYERQPNTQLVQTGRITFIHEHHFQTRNQGKRNVCDNRIFFISTTYLTSLTTFERHTLFNHLWVEPPKHSIGPQAWSQDVFTLLATRPLPFWHHDMFTARNFG